MKYKIITISLSISMIISCGKTISAGGELAELSFYSLPKEIIASLKKKPQGYAQNYVLAQAYLKQKNYKRAILHFANSAFKSKRNFKLRLFPHPVYTFLDGFHLKSPYFDDSIYNIAQLFYKYREYRYVLKFIDLMDSPQGALNRDASILKAKAFGRLKKEDKALATLKGLQKEYTDPDSQAMIEIRLASLYEKLKKFALAAKSYKKLLDSREKWHQNFGAERLYSLIKAENIKLTKTDTIKVAQALMKSGKIKKGKSLAMPLLPSMEGEEPDSLHAQILTLESPAKAKTFVKSRKNRSYYDKLRLIVANTLWRRGGKSRAIEIYKNLVHSRDKEIASGVIIRLSHYYEERNNPSCLKYMRIYTEIFPKTPQSGKFHWLMGRFCLKKGSTSEALRHFNKLISAMPENNNSAKALYWKLRLMGRTDIEKRINIIAEMNYRNPSSPYTLRELNRIARKTTKKQILSQYGEYKSKNQYKKMLLQVSLLFMQEGYAETLADLKKDFPEDFARPFTGFGKIIQDTNFESPVEEKLPALERYFAVGNLSAIKRELAMLPQDDDKIKYQIAVALAKLGAKYHNYKYASLNSFRILGLSDKREYLPFLSKEQARMFYPLAFKKSVMEESKRYAIPAPMILAMIKAESYFVPNAVSPVGAEGLMQLMPVTAKDIAKNLKIKNYNLLKPATSIKFGTSYIKWLHKYYKGQFEYIVAGYNAGAGNVNKWKKLHQGKGIDYFTEFTPFNETRYYIYGTEKSRIHYESIAKTP